MSDIYVSNSSSTGDLISNTNSEQSINDIEQHCHSLLLLQEKDHRAERTLIWVSLLSALFITAEFVGGHLAHSLAIMTDACHMLSDLLSFLLSIIAIRMARSPANQRLSFGFHRAEILGAFISIIIIWILTTILVMSAIQRIVNKDLEVNSTTMIITAVVGVIFNIIMGAVLHYSGSGHGHHAHGSTHSTTKNINVRAALIHVIGDLVQSVGVLVAAIIIKTTGWLLADPICTFFFSIIVLFTSAKILRDIMFILMEGTPSHINYGTLQNELQLIKGVRAVHSLHIWSLNLDKVSLSVHIAIDDLNKSNETMKTASELIRFKHGIHFTTVQIEPFEEIMSSCEYCRPLL